jgi:hypothetical protein
MIFRKRGDQENYIRLSKPTALLVVSSNIELEKRGKIESKLVDVIENSK